MVTDPSPIQHEHKIIRLIFIKTLFQKMAYSLINYFIMKKLFTVLVLIPIILFGQK